MRIAWAAALLACSAAAEPQTPRAEVRIAGKLQDPRITESSGLAASRINPGVYWTHNDSGNGPDLFAIDGTGKSLGRWTVPGARNIDWEDLAIGRGRSGIWSLYIGDIGDNGRNRTSIVIYRVEEPKLQGGAPCRAGCRTERPAIFHLQYPDGPHNAETLLVHPETGDLYVVTKAWGGDRETGVYVIRADDLERGGSALQRIATLNIPDRLTRSLTGGLTGGAISPDGRRVAFCDYLYVYEAKLPDGRAFDEIWKQSFTVRTTGMRLQTEGITYTLDGRSLLLTAEGAATPVVEVR